MLNSQDRKYLCQKYGLTYPTSNAVLCHAMKSIRKDRTTLDEDYLYNVFSKGTFTQLWIQTPACRFSQKGYCTICNYWKGNKSSLFFDSILPNLSFPDETDTLLINTCGSCLDTVELTEEEQNKLIDRIALLNISNVIFETHVHTLTEKTVQRITELLPHKNVFFEIGIESIDSDVLFFSLNKPYHQTDYIKLSDMIHKWNAKCICNVVVGSPYLSEEEQIADAVTSANWLLQNQVDEITLFPINIKPHTLLSYLYDQGKIMPTPSYLIPMVLMSLDCEWLSRVKIAWYGEHREENVIPPQYPGFTQDPMFRLIEDFNLASSTEEAKVIVKHMEMLLAGYKPQVSTTSFAERIDRAYQELETSFL